MPSAATVRFSHVHIYCDRLRPLAEYKKLEGKLNEFAGAIGATPESGRYDTTAGQAAWLALKNKHGDPVARVVDPEQYNAVGQDVVEQLLVGMGMRVTGSQASASTQSVVVTSQDPDGVKFVMSAHTALRLDEVANAKVDNNPPAKRPRTEAGFDHFDVDHLARFARYHKGRQGVAVLGFAAAKGSIEQIRAKYLELHPKLLLQATAHTYPGAQVLEAYAYYTGEMLKSDPDTGTVVRFVELDDASCVLPGMEKVEAVFDGTSQPAYCDHWVSNVISREGFLKTLEDTLGFTPKVDFNAGVVAAGEAQIESTVTGNSPDVVLRDKASALKDQSQVYLPINNAMSEVGHVSMFLRELGQGVQHIASRVADLGSLIQKANDFRKMTGSGFSFLQIPGSYYGYLTTKRLVQEAGLDADAAERCIAALRQANLVDTRNIVAVDCTREAVAAALPQGLPAGLVEFVLRARYGNLYSLLKDHLSEEQYLNIVRNNILVDIQGEDLLLQIFTSKVLQRNDGEEAPFLEFIQRLCSECKDANGCPKPIRPGCGGFGIRNFLTLFLSIEVSKASASRAEAEKSGDARAEGFETQRVDAFTAQLDESNPILTAISDAMTAEGLALENGDAKEAARFGAEKNKGQQDLQALSTRYKEIMKKIREEQAKSA